MRFFNTAGPCKPDIHYMLPASARLPELRTLIDQQAYIVIHAPRQVGKTTTMLQLARELVEEGRYNAVVVTAEPGRAFPEDTGAAELAMLDGWRADAVLLPAELQPPPWPQAQPGARVRHALQAWAMASPRPLALFIDEIDSLEGDVLISVLRQLRAGYPQRPQAFPWSLALIGLRDVRDYKVKSGGSERLSTASPFNIKLESLTLGNFTEEEVATLYRQHTAETGQIFTDETLRRAFELTQGQPWLVNALARQAVEFIETDRRKPITPAIINQAKERIIERQETHLDSLVDRLREPRIRNIIEPILAGKSEVGSLPPDDLRFALDLGLVRRANGGGVVIANPIYREVIPTMLAFVTRAFLPQIAPTWLNPDGSLNPTKLLDAFLTFWRQHGQPLLKSVHYHEIAPHIVLMAFLHCVVNGGGSLEREYAIGTRRMDVCLRYGQVTLGMELKVWRDGESDPLKEGLEQLDHYLDGLGLATGWLVIFDQRSGLPEISERTTTETATTPSGRNVTVIRG